MVGRLIWREKEKSRIKAVQMDSFRDLLGIRKWIECRMLKLEIFAE